MATLVYPLLTVCCCCSVAKLCLTQLFNANRTLQDPLSLYHRIMGRVLCGILLFLFHVCGFCSDIHSLITDIGTLYLLWYWSACTKFCQFYWSFKRTNFWLHWLFLAFLVLISLIYALVFIFSFCLFWFCSSFSSFTKKFRLLILDRSISNISINCYRFPSKCCSNFIPQLCRDVFYFLSFNSEYFKNFP